MDIEKYGTVRKEYTHIAQEEWKIFRTYDRHLSWLTKKAKILEIWPWNGAFSCYVQGTFHIPMEHMDLIDLSASIVSSLQAREETKKFNVYLADSIDFLTHKEDKYYDLIIMRHVMEHMPREYISQLVPLMLSKLRSWWKILVEVPNFGNFPFGMYNCFWDFTHVTYFTYESLIEAFLFNNINDEDIEARPYNCVHALVFWRWILNDIRTIVMRFGSYLSRIITFLLYKMQGDKYWFWRVYTPAILLIVEKR